MSDFNGTTGRRDFIRFLSVLAAGFLIPHSARGREMGRLLDNEDLEGFYIRWYRPVRAPDPKTWRLKVGGLCREQKSFDLAALRNLPKVRQISRLTCVEGWSSKAGWGGFTAKSLFRIVKPLPEAQHLFIECADGYYEYIPLDVILKPRVLFVYEMNDGPLRDIHGGPLRIIVPPKYGYKSAKAITRMDLVAGEGMGYWARFGYSQDGTIQPGHDYALDLKDYRDIRAPGEPDY